MDVTTNLKLDEFNQATHRAVQLGLRDTIVAIHRDVVKLTPHKTGNNARSIVSEVAGMGTVQQGSDAQPEHVVDDSKHEAACYSTSGYGGLLETGTRPHIITVKNAKVLSDGKKVFGKTVHHPGTNPHPYFYPALNMHKDDLANNIKKHLK